jgi:hypothetical protein
VLHATITSHPSSPNEAIVSGDATVGITNSIITSHSVGLRAYAGAIWEDYNLFFGNGADVQGPVTSGGGSVTGDPLFVNPISGNYHLMPGSNAIDIGTNAGVTIDIDGQSRPLGDGMDAGYDEFLDLPLKVYLPLLTRQ